MARRSRTVLRLGCLAAHRARGGRGGRQRDPPDDDREDDAVTRDARGFSIIELVIAAAIMSACGGAILSLVMAGQRIARVQPEAADQQQRARMAIEKLTSELSRAGAGLEGGRGAGPLGAFFIPAETSPDGGLTLWYVADHGGQAAMAAALAPSATDVLIDSGGACPSAQPTCGFTRGSTAIMFDAGGCRD